MLLLKSNWNSFITNEQPVGKTVWQILKELNILLTYIPVIILLDIYLIDLKTYAHLPVNFYSSFIHNCPKMEATTNSFNR